MSDSGSLVEIDGSYGEGGGQIIRTCLSLSAITGRPVELRNVRAGREKPGLKAQQLAAVRAAASICAAEVTGADVGSTQIRFEPASTVNPGVYRFDIGTAGAAPLVIQTLLLPLCRTETRSRITVIGGTHVPHAPSAEYIDAVSRGAGAAVIIAAECECGFAGFSSLGERGKPMEGVAEDACREFMAWWKTGAAVDEHVADQLLLPGSLIPGESRWTTPRVTEHLQTVLWVVAHFLPIEYRLEPRESGATRVIIQGVEVPKKVSGGSPAKR